MAKKEDCTLPLIIPIALIHGAKGELRRLRVVKCMVKITQATLELGFKHITGTAVTKFQHDYESLCIEQLLNFRVKEISLTDVTKDKALRSLFFQKGSAAKAYEAAHIVYGARAITYVNEDTGVVANRNICYTLISHWYNSIDRHEEARVHGFWDYQGNWHEGIAEIPKRPPYSDEMNWLLIKREYYKAFELQPLGSMCRAGQQVETMLPHMQSEIITVSGDIAPMYNPYVGTAASIAAAAKELSGSASTGLNYDKTVYTITPNTQQLHMRVPLGVNEVRVSTDNKPVNVWLPAGVQCLSLLHTGTATVVHGIDMQILRKYVNQSRYMNALPLPKALGTNFYGEPVLIDISPKECSPFIADTLNLAACSSDTTTVSIDVAAQPWNTVIVPTSQKYTRVSSAVTRSVYNLVVLPCVQKYDTTRAVIGAITVDVQFVQNDLNEKTVNIDMRQVMLHDRIDINIANSPRTDVTMHNKVLCCLGICMSDIYYTTDYGVDEDIRITKMSGVLHYTLRRGESAGAGKAGATYIHGSIGTLQLRVWEPTQGRDIKHIYIDGAVGTLEICRLVLPEYGGEARLHALRIHIKRGNAMPKLQGVQACNIHVTTDVVLGRQYTSVSGWIDMNAISLSEDAMQELIYIDD